MFLLILGLLIWLEKFVSISLSLYLPKFQNTHYKYLKPFNSVEWLKWPIDQFIYVLFNIATWVAYLYWKQVHLIHRIKNISIEIQKRF